MTRIPRHLALIPDGNRRWARARGLGPTDGHRAGIRVVGTIAEAAWAAGVEVVTFWWASPSNLQRREPAEVAGILATLSDWLCDEGGALLARAGAAFEVHGRWEALCPEVARGIGAALRAAGPGPKRLVLLMAYDGRDEIRAAAGKLGGGGPDSRAFGRATWTGGLPEVDLVVRSGDEPHLSAAFMAWSAADAQLAFPGEMWPDFTPDSLGRVLADFARTSRRFGG